MSIDFAVPRALDREAVARMSWAEVVQARQSFDIQRSSATRASLGGRSRNSLGGSSYDVGSRRVASEAEGGDDDSVDTRVGRASLRGSGETFSAAGMPREGSYSTDSNGVSRRKASSVRLEYSVESIPAAEGVMGDLLSYSADDLDASTTKLTRRTSVVEAKEWEVEAVVEAMRKQDGRAMAARMWEKEREERKGLPPELLSGDTSWEGTPRSLAASSAAQGDVSEYDDTLDKVYPTLALWDEEDPLGDGSPRASLLSSLPDSIGSANELARRSSSGGTLNRQLPPQGSAVADRRSAGRDQRAVDDSIATSFVTESEGPPVALGCGEYDASSGYSSEREAPVLDVYDGSSDLEESSYYSDVSSEHHDTMTEHDAVSMCSSHYSGSPLEASVMSDASLSDIHLEVALPPVEYSDAEVPFEYRSRAVPPRKKREKRPEATTAAEEIVRIPREKDVVQGVRKVREEAASRPASPEAVAHKRCCVLM